MAIKLVRHVLALLTFLFSLFPSSVEAVTSSPHFGLTVITHGFQTTDGTPAWLITMGTAVVARNGGATKTPIYKLRLKRGATSNLVDVDYFLPLGNPVDPVSTSSVVVVVDWSDIACLEVEVGEHVVYDCPDETSTKAIGDVVFETIKSDPLMGKFLRQTPMHLIAHSRGAGVASEIPFV